MKTTLANSVMNNANKPSHTRAEAGWSRRKFVARSAAAVAAFSVVPRHVLGGGKFVAPSEKINVASIG